MDGLPNGFAHYPLYFDVSQQAQLIEAVKTATETAPFFQTYMPRTGTPLSVVLTNFGTMGWVSDKERGYRYEPVHPKTKTPWPPLPDLLLKLWKDVAGYEALPEACLVNWYRADAGGGKGAKMGLHIDSDEMDVRAPVVSVSLGDPAMFRFGGTQRGGTTHGIKLFSGDVVVLADEARLCYHGVSKVDYGETALVPKGGRINLTMRRVNF